MLDAEGENAMSADEAALIDSFWEARGRGEYFPTAWFDRLTIDQAYPGAIGPDLSALRGR